MIALVVVALVFVAVGVVYFTRTAGDLPAFFPGHEDGSTKHHTKHGIAMIGLAVLALTGAWMASGPSTESSTE